MKKILVIMFAAICVLSINGFAQQSKAKNAQKPNTEVKAEKDKVVSGVKGPEGQLVYEGAKGGQYYINKNGNKTYIKDEDKVVKGKKGPEGQPVYVGPNGGEYYINKSGNKTYLKK